MRVLAAAFVGLLPLLVLSDPLFDDPEMQAQHEQNLEWLRLMRDDPGWGLSRLHRLQELEAAIEREGYVCKDGELLIELSCVNAATSEEQA